MKELKLIIQMLETERNNQYEEVDKCNSAGWKYAAQYASGKITAYNYAIDLITAYVNHDMPFET